ncbi:hypothetical protein DPMN_001473 [Dreissena polymorpha]|uniref:Uncharacterized protein n=1 Tax=Dreissena polymorpha TaxID=45954 RepID=A0A9D4MJD7_DREPO|nr:hypothetical protein DPMN_001473 [Dreissena polymorpha]
MQELYGNARCEVFLNGRIGAFFMTSVSAVRDVCSLQSCLTFAGDPPRPLQLNRHRWKTHLYFKCVDDYDLIDGTSSEHQDNVDGLSVRAEARGRR